MWELGLTSPPRLDGWQAVKVVLGAGTDVGVGLFGARGGELPQAGL